MPEFSDSIVLNRSRKEAWKLVTDVENFPKYIKFLSGVKLQEPFKLGSHWSDWTTILYVPIHINHVNTKLEEEKVFEYKFGVGLGGTVLQRFEIIKGDNPTEVKFSLVLDFPNRLARFFVLPILESRWQVVMKEARRRVELEENERKTN